MRLLYGLYAPDAGVIEVGGHPLRLRGPADGLAAGISMVHQQSLLLGDLTVAENVLLSERGRRPVRRRQVEDGLARLAEENAIQVDPRTRVRSLSVAARQRSELLIALYHRSSIIILDEPTTILTPQEVEQLFETLRRLRQAGRTILFVTHKLHEVMAITDAVTVIRRGVVVGSYTTRSTTIEQLTVAILGLDQQQSRRLDDAGATAASAILGTSDGAAGSGPVPSTPSADGEILHVSTLAVRYTDRVLRVDQVSLEVRRGEIVAVTGIEGNGQRELAEAIVGIRPAEAGVIRLSGAEITRSSVRRRRALGLSYVPEDRVGAGSAAGMSVADNIAAGAHRSPALSRHGLRNRAAWAKLAATVVSKYRVVAESTAEPISSLSGGNIQKVIAGRELERDPTLLVVVQPTQGLDIGSTAQIWAELRALRERGRSVLLVSTDLAEVRALADRALVMKGGRVVAELARGARNEERIGRAALGRAP
jgi:general nucleoside transport system ATP-binding protein